MIIQIPSTTKELMGEIQEAADKLPSEDRNAFVLDLIKFCADWQLSYLAFKSVQG